MPLKILLLILTLSFSLSACQALSTPSSVSTLNVIQQTEAVTLPAATEISTGITEQTEASPNPVPYPYPLPYPGYSSNNALQPLDAYPGPYPEFSTNAGGQSTNTAPPYIFKTSVPGSVTLHGVLLVMDPMLSRPEGEDPIFLVPLVGEGVMSVPQFEIGKVPQAEVDETTGEFTFTNIQPGRYGVVILTVGAAQIPARFYEGNSFAIVNVKDSDLGQTIELEYLVI